MPKEWPDRLIGEKEIVPFFEYYWRISTWDGCLYCIKKNKMPLRRTLSGRPMIIPAEMQEFERLALLALNK